jgi:hypothetical protein
MKKVRYLIGAVGAVPALGGFAPIANAAVVSTNIRCAIGGIYHNKSHVGTGANRFSGEDLFGRTGDIHCLYGIAGHLSHSQRGLLMRARAYWHGNKILDQYVGGTINPISSSTSFYIDSLNRDASKACEALVYSTNRNKVAYGPVCEPVDI